MAKERKNPPDAEEKRHMADSEGGEYSAFLLEEVEDNRAMRFSLGFAVAVHIVFLFLPLISFSEPEIADKKEQTIFVMEAVKWEKPKPPPIDTLPEIQATKKPIPDPTPDAPEPLVYDVQETEIQLSNLDDVVFTSIPKAPPVEEPAGPIYVGGDVKAPVKIFHPAPQYTEIARKARVQGYVTLQTIIDKEGNVTNVKVLKPLSMGLTEEAVKAVLRWKFKPATLNAKPVEVYYVLTVNFRLQ